ncbi:MAG TPA: hypothetical protein VED63_12705 [Acidimicrobiales bacterium]|nr:hypothetical protein [Acidimicrobiales bacterium]
MAILGVLGIALIHLLDLPGTIGPDPIQGTLYLVLVVSCVATAGLLLHAASPWRWLLVLALAAAPAGAYVLTRTVGLPFDQTDIGNWDDTLGIAALFVEALVFSTGAYALVLWRRIAASGEPDRSAYPMATELGAWESS